MTRNFGFALPGSIYEVSRGITACLPKLGNMYSFAVPIIKLSFFGIQPECWQSSNLYSPTDGLRLENQVIQKVLIGTMKYR